MTYSLAWSSAQSSGIARRSQSVHALGADFGQLCILPSTSRNSHSSKQIRSHRLLKIPGIEDSRYSAAGRHATAAGGCRPSAVAVRCQATARMPAAHQWRHGKSEAVTCRLGAWALQLKWHQATSASSLHVIDAVRVGHRSAARRSTPSRLHAALQSESLHVFRLGVKTLSVSEYVHSFAETAQMPAAMSRWP